jgi:hypothetical protein
MTLTIGFGWWLLPALITAVACAASWWIDTYDSRRGYSRSEYLGGLVSALIWSPAIIVSLFGWLVWAVLT